MAKAKTKKDETKPRKTRTLTIEEINEARFKYPDNYNIQGKTCNDCRKLTRATILKDVQNKKKQWVKKRLPFWFCQVVADNESLTLDKKKPDCCNLKYVNIFNLQVIE